MEFANGLFQTSQHGVCIGSVVYGLVSVALTLRSQPISFASSRAWQCERQHGVYRSGMIPTKDIITLTLNILDTADLSLCSELCFSCEHSL